MANTILAVATFLAGIALAQRFTVYVLVPAVFIAAILATGVGAHMHASFPNRIAYVLCAMTCVQLGYIFYVLAVLRLFPPRDDESEPPPPRWHPGNEDWETVIV